MNRFLYLLIFVSLIGCESGKTLDEVDFEGSKFGLEYVPDKSLEGYNEKYHPFFQSPNDPKRRYLLNVDDGFMFSNFPKKAELLNGVDVMIVDTIARTYQKYDRTEALTTLYVDPKVIDQASFKTLKNFLKESYSKQDADNKMIRWLNYREDTLAIDKTIYAVVYSDLASLEPVYSSADGKKSIKIGVDEFIYVKDNTEQSPGWLYRGQLTDSIMVAEYADYEKDGVKFKAFFDKERSL